jgi:hypothetical protein
VIRRRNHAAALVAKRRRPAETVEQYLARGGEIEHVARGVGGACRKCRRRTGVDLPLVGVTGMCVECHGSRLRRGAR